MWGAMEKNAKSLVSCSGYNRNIIAAVVGVGEH
jgi:hypothetical protein